MLNYLYLSSLEFKLLNNVSVPPALRTQFLGSFKPRGCGLPVP